MPGKIVRSPVVNWSWSSSVATFGEMFARDEAGLQDRFRFGGEQDAARTFRVVERLDAERIAREIERAGRGIGERDGVHAAQGLGEIGAARSA